MKKSVGGIDMMYLIIVGAGACKTPESIVPYMREDLPIGAIITGSYTPEARAGNEGTLFYPDSLEGVRSTRFGLNSFGMPNIGFYALHTKILGKKWLNPVILSLAGFSVDDYVSGVKVFGMGQHNISGIEINAGCPNAHELKTLPMSYDLEFMKQMLDGIELLAPKIPIWLKLSPYITKESLAVRQSDFPGVYFGCVPTVTEDFIQKVAKLVGKYSFIRAVVCSNTLPNVIYSNGDGRTVTTPNDGKAGMSGPIMKSISMDLVKKMKSYLPSNIDVIHSGGVLTGDDAVDCLENGADGVQCTSGPFWHGDGGRFCAELLQSERLQEYLLQNLS